jgi:hypothetical protein
VTPALRLALSLVVSLLLWLPTIPTALAMHDPPETIALRYLLALVVSRVGVGAVFRVVRMYAAAVVHDDEEPASGADQGPSVEVPFGRRRSDQSDQSESEVTEEQQLDDALEEAHEAAVLSS